MMPFIVLIASLLIFRGLGEVGVVEISTWHGSARYALAVMFLFTATAHFTRMKEDLIKMVPAVLPRPRTIVLATGILEIVGAVGILIPVLRSLAGICLILMMAAMFPANVNAAQLKIPLRGKPPTSIWIRLPIQLLFIGFTWWASR